MRPAFLIALASTSFATVAAGVRAFVPLPAGYGLRAKLEHIAKHPDAYDTLFVGSSIVFRGIEPDTVELAFKNRGATVRVFNLGIPGLHAFELDYVLRYLTDVGVSAERLFVEHIPRQAQSLDPEKLTDRSIYWRTAPVTWAALRTIALSDRSPWDKTTTAWLQVRLMMRRYGNHAIGKDLVRAAIGPDDAFDYLRPQELIEQRGYQDPDTLSTQKSATRRRIFLEQGELYKERVQSTVSLLNVWRDDPSPERVLRHYDTEGVRQQFAATQAIAKEVTVVIGPVLTNADKALALEQVTAYPRVLSLCDPLAYPILYARDLRFDHAHMNRRGAEHFSRTLVNLYANDDPPATVPRPRPARRSEGR